MQPRYNIKFIGSLIFWAVLWQVISNYIIKDQVIFPNSSTILKNSFELIFINHKIIVHIIGSGKRYFIAIALAIPVAVLSAILVAGSNKAKDFFYPIISLTYPLPKVAILPFLLLVFGTGDSAKIVMIGLGIYYLLFINIFTELSLILKGQLGDIVFTYKIRGFNFWYHFLFKGCYRSFLIGLKSALGYGLTLVVVSEISIAKNGVGFFIWSAWDAFRIADLYSAMLILAVIGYAINAFCDYLISGTLSE